VPDGGDILVGVKGWAEQRATLVEGGE